MSDQQCREAFEKLYGKRASPDLWTGFFDGWNYLPSFVVPSRHDLDVWFYGNEGKPDPFGSGRQLFSMEKGLDAIHSHLLAQGAKESVAWEALERISKMEHSVAAARQVALTALATRKEGV